VRHDPITSIDIAPTFAAAAGVATRADVEGVPLLGVARNGDRGWTRLHKTTVGVVALLVLVAAGGLLTWAGKVSARNREREGAMY